MRSLQLLSALAVLKDIPLADAWGPREFKTLVTFGDSYTDDTRLDYFIAHNGTAPPVGWVQPVANNSSSGGYTWGHYVAQETHVNRYNYAVSGAACSNTITPRVFAFGQLYPSVLEYEIPAFVADSMYTADDGNPFLDIAEDSTIYTMWIGTNDLGNNALLTDSQAPGKTIPDYLDCVYTALDRIYESGGRYFVLMNLAPLQLSPQYGMPGKGGVKTPQLWKDKPDNTTAVSYKMWETVVTVNEVYKYRTPAELLIEERYPGAEIAVMDMYELLSDIYNDAEEWFGPGANETGYIKHCDNSGKNCIQLPNGDKFMWFDQLHPSQQTDQFIAEEFLKVVKGESDFATYWS